MAGRPPNPDLRRSRKETVLGAAMRLFAERGVRQTTMKDICEAAAISPGALYRYFASKEDIILAIADLEARDVALLVAAIETGEDLVSTLETWADRIASWQTEDLTARLTVEFSAEALRNPQVADAFRAADARLREALETAIRRDLAAGRIVGGFDPANLAFLVQSLFDGVAGRTAFAGQPAQTAFADDLRRLIGLLRA